jgi:hypothetical protein
MNSHIDAKNPSARALLKWISDAVKQPSISEALRKGVTRVECEGTSDGFSMRMVVKDESTAKEMDLHKPKILSELQRGFREQGGTNLKEIHFLHK